MKGVWGRYAAAPQHASCACWAFSSTTVDCAARAGDQVSDSTEGCNGSMTAHAARMYNRQRCRPLDQQSSPAARAGAHSNLKGQRLWKDREVMYNQMRCSHPMGYDGGQSSTKALPEPVAVIFFPQLKPSSCFDLMTAGAYLHCCTM